MHEFTHDETRRWDAWRRTSALAAQRTDRVARIVGVVLLVAALGALVAGLW